MAASQAHGPSSASRPAWSAGINLPRVWVAVGVLAVLLGLVGTWLFMRGDPRLSVAPPVAPTVSRIAAGNSHTCAVTGDGHVKCWGDNHMGQLGDGTFAQRLTPVEVNGLDHVRAIATGSGSHTCALTESGAVKCWGSNEYGQLGNNDTASSSLPVQATGLESGALGIAVGRSHSCAVTGKGLYCWGDNSAGALGNGTNDSSLVPVAVPGYSAKSAIALGDALSCGIVDGGRVRCWGDDGDGQLGDQGFTAVNTPLPVAGIDGPVVSVSASDTHVCAVTAASEVWCWGANSSAQLGLGSTSPSSTPTKVPGVKDVTSVVAGFQRTCVLHSTGLAECWGGITEGAPDAGKASPTSVLELGQDVASLSLGTFHGCLVTTAGSVRCWGTNTNGQLGNGSTADSPVPVEVQGL